MEKWKISNFSLSFRWICHCEPVTESLVWQSPKVFDRISLVAGGFPRQFENWLGMTPFLLRHRVGMLNPNLQKKDAANAASKGYLPKRGRATRLYRSKVRMETPTPLTMFNGATHSTTKLVRLSTPGRMAVPIAMMVSRGRP